MIEHESPKFNGNIFERKCREIYFELKQIGLEENECWAEAKLMLEHITGLKQAQQTVSNLDNFQVRWHEEITRILNLRRQRTPLAYCLGEVEFAGLAFRIIPGVLIPRVDTEALIEAVVEKIEKAQNIEKQNIENEEKQKQEEEHGSIKLNIAEIGVGSGIVAISLLKRLPNCTVWACDISEAAIAVSLGNARRHGVHERLTLIHGDWRKILPNDFDVIVSNPPYVPSSLQSQPLANFTGTKKAKKNKQAEVNRQILQPEIHFEPKEALFAGEDGLDFYRQFASQLPGHFSTNKPFSDQQPPTATDKGRCFGVFEFGDGQEEAVQSIFKKHGWQDLQIKKDTNNLARVLTAIAPGHK